MIGAIIGLTLEGVELGFRFAQAGIRVKELNRQKESLQEQAMAVEADLRRAAAIEGALMSARTAQITGNIQAYAANVGLDSQSSAIRESSAVSEGVRQQALVREDLRISIMDLNADVEDRLAAIDAQISSAYVDAVAGGIGSAGDFGRLGADIRARRKAGV